MTSRKLAVLAICGVLLGFESAHGQDAKPGPQGVDYFEKEVRPLLAKRCFGCHSKDAKQRGGLALDSKRGWQEGGDSGPALMPGAADKSLLIAAIRYQALKMPPSGQLPKAEIDVLVRWVAMGAPDPRTGDHVAQVDPRDHWAFQPTKDGQPPTVRADTWTRSAIDRFLLARMEEKQVQPAADAERTALLRRLTFDLIGLPPTPDEVTAFAHDGSPDALTKVVDRLLASPHFGERWGRHWLDVARYAEFGNGGGGRAVFADAWRYRDYVIAAFNKDKPYDRFIVEQLAGDLLPASSVAQRDEQVIATGFLTLSPLITSAPGRGDQFRMDLVDEQIDVTTRAFLGLTVACARCHDHKFDPIPTTDYYALAGIFRSTELRQRMMSPKKRRIATFFLGVPLEGHSAKEGHDYVTNLFAIQDTQERIEELKKLLGTSTKKGAKTPATKDNAARAQQQQELELLQERLVELRSMKLELPPMASAVSDAVKPADVRVHIRGELENLGPTVPRGFLTALRHAPAAKACRNSHSGRATEGSPSNHPSSR